VHALTAGSWHQADTAGNETRINSNRRRATQKQDLHCLVLYNAPLNSSAARRDAAVLQPKQPPNPPARPLRSLLLAVLRCVRVGAAAGPGQQPLAHAVACPPAVVAGHQGPQRGGQERAAGRRCGGSRTWAAAAGGRAGGGGGGAGAPASATSGRLQLGELAEAAVGAAGGRGARLGLQLGQALLVGRRAVPAGARAGGCSWAEEGSCRSDRRRGRSSC
jgi:hypothetical protein